MSIPKRLIARLDVKAPNVIKGVHLEGLRVVGKPGEMARRYYHDGIDEIIFMDVVASLYERNTILDMVSEAAEDIFVPMTVGGGLRNINDISQVLRSGADKVAVNTAAVQRPEFLSDASTAFGSQCIVLSVEAKRSAAGSWEVLTDNGRERTGLDVLDWVARGEELGAGEILLTSVDQEGTRKGMDVELLEAVYQRVSIPVIGCGGVGTVDHAVEVMSRDALDALCCAAIFHDDVLTVSGLKASLEQHEIAVRPIQGASHD